MKYPLNKSLLALTIGGILASNAQAAITDIIISEYVEGDDYNTRAIELTNTGSEDYTFPSDLYLQYYNGSYTNNVLAATTEDVSVLSGVTIEANSTIVIINGAAEDDLIGAITVTDTENDIIKTTTYQEKGYSSLSFTGNATVSLMNITDNTVYDIIGEAGTYWGADTTARRRLTEDGLTPVQSSTYDETGWEFFVLGTFDGLGLIAYSDVYVE
ncbi:nuclease, partial [Psychromonas sp.]|nr:nuclease [Psychromonas sp.]